MKDISVLTLISTVFLMSLTLTTMFLISVPTFNVDHFSSFKKLPVIWKAVRFYQIAIGLGGIVIGFLWLFYSLSGMNFPYKGLVQILVYSLSIFFDVELLILLGIVGILIAYFLHPEEIWKEKLSSDV